MTQKRYYIAYGSNLSVEQMAYRCPTAKLVGTGVLEGWALIFKTYASIEPDDRSNVPVAIWEILPDDEKSLDIYEEYPTCYYKKELDLPVKLLENGETRQLTAMVYIMNEHYPFAEPQQRYYKIIEDGYQYFGFPKDILHEALIRI